MSGIVRNVHAAPIGPRAAAILALSTLPQVFAVRAENTPARGVVDSRVRVAAYVSDEVYRLFGRVGYQIDLQFEPGETFVGIGAGDLEGLSFVAQDNHLFLKPKAAQIRTNLTVLTSRRYYQFDYNAEPARPSADDRNVMYALRFTYSPVHQARDAATAETIDGRLHAAPAQALQNFDYWYCGSPALRPVAASDDGVHTRLRFADSAEQPAIFVRNEDGSESLLNFSIESGDVIVHRLAQQFVVRRGRLSGCIVNKGFVGNSGRLESGTIAPTVQRANQESRP